MEWPSSPDGMVSSVSSSLFSPPELRIVLRFVSGGADVAPIFGNTQVFGSKARVKACNGVGVVTEGGEEDASVVEVAPPTVPLSALLVVVRGLAGLPLSCEIKAHEGVKSDKAIPPGLHTFYAHLRHGCLDSPDHPFRSILRHRNRINILQLEHRSLRMGFLIA